jgi:hypothetical protein
LSRSALTRLELSPDERSTARGVIDLRALTPCAPGGWRLRALLSHLFVRASLTSLWLYADDSGVEDQPWIVIAPHQTMLDIPAAVRASDALGHDFGTWAHPGVLRRAPFVRRMGFLETPTDAAGFRRLIQSSRDFLRGRPNRALWVFPQGKFVHRSARVTSNAGIRLLIKACPEVPVMLAGIDYSLFRGGRPHGLIELRRVECPLDGLDAKLEEAMRSAGSRAAAELPKLVRPWFRSSPESGDEVGRTQGS